MCKRKRRPSVHSPQSLALSQMQLPPEKQKKEKKGFTHKNVLDTKPCISTYKPILSEEFTVEVGLTVSLPNSTST